MHEAAVVVRGEGGGEGQSGNLLSFHLKHIGHPLNLLFEESDKRPERNTGFFLGWSSFRWQRDVQYTLVKAMVALGGFGLASKSQIPNG